MFKFLDFLKRKTGRFGDQTRAKCFAMTRHKIGYVARTIDETECFPFVLETMLGLFFLFQNVKCTQRKHYGRSNRMSKPPSFVKYYGLALRWLF